MCIFNREVAQVKETSIMVGRTKDGRQLTIYENKVTLKGSTNNAMILYAQ